MHRRKAALVVMSVPERKLLSAMCRTEVTGTAQPYEKEYLHKNGNRVPVLVGSAQFEEAAHQSVAFVLDLTERKLAEKEARENERRYSEAQMELAQANRVATVGQLSASIAHEVDQPIGAAATNAHAALRWLRGQPPNVEEALLTLDQIADNTKHASEIIGRIRALVAKAPQRKEPFDINSAIREVIMLAQGEVRKNGISVATALGEGLPPYRSRPCPTAAGRRRPCNLRGAVPTLYVRLGKRPRKKRALNILSTREYPQRARRACGRRLVSAPSCSIRERLGTVGARRSRRVGTRGSLASVGPSFRYGRLM